MFCSKCGTKNHDNTKYCGGCGLDISRAGVASTEAVNFQYYGKNWRGAQYLPLGIWRSSAYYDVAVDNKFVYLIKFPPYSSAFWYGFVGFFLLSLIGVIIGAAIGGRVDSNKRANFRSTWIGEQDHIISRLYEGRIFKKIPINQLKSNTIFKKSSIKFAIDDKNYIFKTAQTQMIKFVNATS